MNLAFHSVWVCTALIHLVLEVATFRPADWFPCKIGSPKFLVLLRPPLDVCPREIVLSCCFTVMCLSYMFNHLNLEVCILTASVTCWHIPFYISISFLNNICHFKVRDTWVSKEPHDMYYCFCFITSLAFWATCGRMWLLTLKYILCLFFLAWCTHSMI
jgi:hypothetical protein